MVAYNTAASRSLRNEISSTQRDPQTGVVLGTEALDLGPQDAAQGCLLIHGYVGARKDFGDLGERLGAEGMHVRMVRLPGHGTTPEEFRAQTPDTLLEHARAELRSLSQRYDRVFLVGFSMGGTIATLLASQEKVDRLVLISPYFGVTYYWYYVLPPETWNGLLSPVIPYVIKTDRFICVNKRESLGRMYSYRAIPTRGAATLIELGQWARDPETLRRIACPLLMLHSRGDEAASPKAAATAFESLGSREKQIHWYSDRSNHHLLLDYDGQDALERIVGFLLIADAAVDKP